MSAYSKKLKAGIQQHVNALVTSTTGLNQNDATGNYGRAVDFVSKTVAAPHQYVAPTPKKVDDSYIFFLKKKSQESVVSEVRTPLNAPVQQLLSDVESLLLPLSHSTLVYIYIYHVSFNIFFLQIYILSNLLLYLQYQSSCTDGCGVHRTIRKIRSAQPRGACRCVAGCQGTVAPMPTSHYG